MMHDSVNMRTNKMAKHEAMAHLGTCIKRLIQLIESDWEGLPFLFAKLGVKDGFWRMAVSDNDAWNFCYVLPSLKPTNNINDIKLVVPNSLQMEWCESPPYFCTGSQTARDIIDCIRLSPLPSHTFEDRMLIKTPTSGTATHRHTTTVEVYVDNFIGMTNNPDANHLQNLLRTMLHSIHAIFPSTICHRAHWWRSHLQEKFRQRGGRLEYRKGNPWLELRRE